MADGITEAVAPTRFVQSLLLCFALLTLLCAALGLYGTIAFDVRRRTREIGIRLAIGASPGVVVVALLRRVALVSSLGMAGGLLLATILGPALRGQLYGVGPGDPVSWLVAVVVVGGASMLAGLVPAWRVTALDPRDALGAE